MALSSALLALVPAGVAAVVLEAERWIPPVVPRGFDPDYKWKRLATTTPMSFNPDDWFATKPYNCTCLHWQDVYRDTKCGSGQEFFFALGEANGNSCSQGFECRINMQKALQKHYRSQCSQFYMQLPGNACLNLGQNAQETSWTNSQWCYVNKDLCPDAPQKGGGEIWKYNWKKCPQDGSVLTLRRMSVDQLIKYSKDGNVPLHTLVRNAWSMWEDQTWEDVQGFFGIAGHLSDEELPPFAQDKLRKVVASGKPMIFDSLTHHPPFGVVEGDKIYEVQHNPAQEDFKKHTWYTIKCVHGCQNSDEFDDS